MNKTLKLSLVAFAIIAGTLLLIAGVGGTGPRYVGRFFGDGTGLSNSVDLVEGPNILITPGPGNRAYTIESTAAGAAGIFTNGIMGYGDEYRTNYVRISPIGVTVNSGALISDRLVVLDAAASNHIAGDMTLVGDMTIGGSNYVAGDMGIFGTLFVDGVSASGTIFTSDIFEGNGSGITNLTGDEIRSGTVADARIASTIARDSELLTNIVDAAGGVTVSTNLAAGGIVSVQSTALGTTIAPILWLTNGTLAAAGAQQASPALMLGGAGWNTTGSTSAPVSMGFYTLPVQSSTPTANLYFVRMIGGASPAISGAYVTSSGAVGSAGFYGPIISDASGLTYMRFGHAGLYIRIISGTQGGINGITFGGGDTDATLWITTNTPAISVISTKTNNLNYAELGITAGTNRNEFASLKANQIQSSNYWTGKTVTLTNGQVIANSFTGSGAGLTNLDAQHVINVLNYGAENDNSPDATAAIQAALNYARTNDYGRGIVFMPAGTYRVDGTLWIPTGVTLQGEGRGAYSTLINKNFAGAAIGITNGYTSVKHLTITTDDSPSTGIYGIMTGMDWTGTNFMQLDTPHIEDVFVSMFEIGFYVRNTWTGEIVDCTARDNVKGIVFTNTVNSMRIEGGHYAANTNGMWIDMTTSAEITIKNASIEGNKQRGIYAADVRGPLTIEQNYFEVNGGSGIYTGGYDIDVDGVASAVNLRIAGNYFNSTHTNIFVKDVVNAEIIGNRFEGGGGVYTNDTYIVADAGCAALKIENNTFPDAGTNYLGDVPSYFSVQTNVVVKGASVTAQGFASTFDNQDQPVIIMVQNTNTASATWTNITLVNQVYYITGGTNVVVGINDLATVMSWPSYIGNATVILQPTEWLLLDYDSNPQVVRKAF